MHRIALLLPAAGKPAGGKNTAWYASTAQYAVHNMSQLMQRVHNSISMHLPRSGSHTHTCSLICVNGQHKTFPGSETTQHSQHSSPAPTSANRAAGMLCTCARRFASWTVIDDSRLVTRVAQDIQTGQEQALTSLRKGACEVPIHAMHTPATKHACAACGCTECPHGGGTCFLRL